MGGISKFIIMLLCNFFILVVCSCSNSSSIEESSETPLSCDIKFPIDSTNQEVLNEKTVKFSIDLIAQYNEYHADYVGYGGGKSDIYKAFEMIRDSLEIKELFKLLKHDSQAVRVYAHFAIEQKDSTQVDKAWSALRGKKEKLFTLNGCIGMMETVKEVVKGLEMYELKNSK